ncbi:uncharacterized protein [Nicotiana sylvestris]|uniref:uncharacterized protein n=1 Tax=Nicotiana sylvestris TaxID=4096 RepID=UPI00388C4C3C
MEDIFKAHWAAIAFTSNLNEKSSEATRRLKECLREFSATTWNDVYNRYSTKLRIEEDIVPRSQKEENICPRRAETDKRSGKNRYEPYMGPAGKDSLSKQDNQRHVRKPRNKEAGSSSRFRNERHHYESWDNDRSLKARFGGYNFNVSTSELVAVLRSMGNKVRWPKEMRSNPNRRNPNHWCEFHNDHGHKTTDCRFLQSEVDHLLKQGYLTELFSEKGINGVSYTAANKVSKVTITQGKRVRQVLEEDNITFNNADADSVLTPHNDALVISLIVFDTNVKRVLIDPRSSVSIILLRVLREMQVEEKIIPKAHTLSRFDNSSVVTKGEVTLTTFAEGVIKDTKFQVVDMEMAYNMILGRPWIHEIDAVPLTLHQVIKFPSPWGIYVDSRPDTIQEPEENEDIKTTIEELEPVVLFAQWPDKKVYVGANLDQGMKEIPPEVMTHKLNEDPSYPPVKQKKRKQGIFKNQDHFEWNEECQQALRNLKTYLSNPPLLAKPKVGEKLLLYLAVSEVVVSTILVREEQEMRYPQLEKLAFALIMAVSTQGIQLESERELLVFNGANPGTWTLFTDGSSNVRGVEYEAMIAGLELARELGINQIIIKSDSQLVVNQMLGTYTARVARMQQYLEKYGTISDDKRKACALRRKAARYCLKQGNLYRKMFGGPLARCLGPSQTEYVMREVHEGHCGNHAGGRSLITEFFQSWQIKWITSTPYHPMGNGQAESTNKIIINNLKKHLREAKGNWPEVLPGVLWAYRTTAKTSTGETPFSLVFGAEALIPVEIGESSTRFMQATKESNSEEMRVNLDLLEGRREAALIRMAAQKQVIERYYNRKTRLRFFKIENFVLKKVFQSTKVTNSGKLSPTWEGPYRINDVAGKGAYELETMDGKILPSDWNAVHWKRYYF